MKSAAFGLGVLLTACAAVPAPLYFARVPESAARKFLERNSSSIAPTDIVYYDRATGELYSSARKIDGVTLKPISMALASQRNVGLGVLLKCRAERNCDSVQFENCFFETPPSENNSEATADALFFRLRKLGYPVIGVVYFYDGRSSKTLKIMYFTECDKISTDVERLR